MMCSNVVIKTVYLVVVGTNVSLECLGVGTPTPSVSWRRVGGSLPKDRQQVVVGALRIANVRAADNGQYVCEVSNGVHPSISHQITLRVQGNCIDLFEFNKLSILKLVAIEI